MMNKIKKAINISRIIRKLYLFIGFGMFAIFAFVGLAEADYNSSVAAIQKCTGMNFEYDINAMNAAEDDCVSKVTFSYPSASPSEEDYMQNIYNRMQEARETIAKKEERGEKLDCKLSDFEVVWKEVKTKAESSLAAKEKYAKEALGKKGKFQNRKGFQCSPSDPSAALKSYERMRKRIDRLYESMLSQRKVLNASGRSALEELQQCAPGSAAMIKEKINKLSSMSHKTWDATDNGGDMADDISDLQKKIADELKRLKKSGTCSDGVLYSVSESVKSLSVSLLGNIISDANKNGDEALAQSVYEKVAEVKARAALRACPLVADVKAKYHSGCWSCLVLEKITSAFLQAAKVGLPVTQRAGVTVLILGIAIWLVVWGLKNVSSFTEIQIGNILNELLKFLFKAALAYWLIYHSLPFIKNYLIYPIMSAGSLIGQQFWDDDIKKFTESWVDLTDEDYAEMAKDFQEQDKKQGETPVPSASAGGKNGQATTPVPTELTPEQKKLLANQPTRLKVVGNIPDFVLPGCSGCRLTSPSGPRSSCSGVCSSCHGGADFGARSVGVQGDPIWAIAPGKVHSISNQSKAGHYIVLEHDAKGQKWYSVYMHLMNGSEKVQRGQKVVARQQIANMGNTGSSTGAHLHLEIWDAAPFTQWQHQLNPLWLAHKEKVPAKKWCYEEMGDKDPYAGQCQNKCVFEARSISGKTSDELPDLSSTYIGTSGVGEGGFSTDDYSSLIVEIPEIRYTGPTDIMPKSVMNSILGAIRAITDKTADVKVLGDVIMCYAGMPNGGAIKMDGITGVMAKWFKDDPYVIHPFIWLAGCVILCFGFFLTFAIAYYLIDISFKIGFAVLALPLVIGLWPFEITKKKFIDTISIITKASATFAFFVLTTSFGMAMLENSFANGLDKIYDMIDILAGLSEETQTAEVDRMKAYLNNETTLFSMTFLTILFSLIYFIKLIQATTSDLVNKFFPDGVFGDQSPMHKGATMATSFAKNIAMKPVGMARDIAAHQAGEALKATGKGVAHAVRHPIRTAKATVNKFRGKK